MNQNMRRILKLHTIATYVALLFVRAIQFNILLYLK